MSISRIVYSTGRDKAEPKEEHGPQNIRPSEQKVRLHLDRKGGGKIVTVIKGLAHDDVSMVSMTRELKKRCGTGGSYKNNEILIQGNKRETIQKILLEKGYDAKFSGG